MTHISTDREKITQSVLSSEWRMLGTLGAGGFSHISTEGEMEERCIGGYNHTSSIAASIACRSRMVKDCSRFTHRCFLRLIRSRSLKSFPR